MSITIIGRGSSARVASDGRAIKVPYWAIGDGGARVGACFDASSTT